MSLHRVMLLVRNAMEDADAVRGADGAAKKAFVIEAVRALTEDTMDEDDANLVNALVPYAVDLVVAASRGELAVNVRQKARRRCLPCFTVGHPHPGRRGGAPTGA